MVSGVSVLTGESAARGGGFGRGRFAEDEEFDESADEDYDGELAKEEACEGQAGGLLVACVMCGLGDVRGGR